MNQNRTQAQCRDTALSYVDRAENSNYIPSSPYYANLIATAQVFATLATIPDPIDIHLVSMGPMLAATQDAPVSEEP